MPIDYTRRDEHDCNGYRVVPMRWAVEILGKPYKDCMRAKYTLLGMDWTKWKDGAMWERDKAKEDALFDFSAGHFIDEPYSLVFDKFGSDSQFTNRNTWNTRHVHIRVQQMDSYSLFDWATVMERATEIHAVSSSCIYLFELLDLQCPIHIYKREPIEKNHENYDYIITRSNYIFH